MRTSWIAALLLAYVASGCTATVNQPTPQPTVVSTKTTLRTTQIKPDAYAGAAFFSDEEFRSLRLKVVNLDDLARYPLPAVTLAPRTRVQIIDVTTMKLGNGASPGTLEVDFEQVRVLDGPASGREGWVSAATLDR